MIDVHIDGLHCLHFIAHALFLAVSEHVKHSRIIRKQLIVSSYLYDMKVLFQNHHLCDIKNAF